MPQPPIQLAKTSGRVSDAEVLPPSDQIRAQLGDDLFDAAARVALRNPPHSLLHLTKGFGRAPSGCQVRAPRRRASRSDAVAPPEAGSARRAVARAAPASAH